MKYLLQRMANKLIGRPDKTPAPLCFVHIPKCAGISVVQALRGAYPGLTPRSLNIPAAWQALQETHSQWSPAQWTREWAAMRQAALRAYLAEGCPLVYGHMPLTVSTRRLHQQQYRFITVLREPIERFFSHYRYDRVGPGITPGSHLEASDPAKELDAYLESDDALWLAREPILMLSGVTGDDFYSPTTALEQARENLQAFSAVGFANNLPAFAQAVSRLVEKPVAIPHANTSQSVSPLSREYDTLLTKERRQRIAELCTDDYELWHWARARFPNMS